MNSLGDCSGGESLP